MKRCGAFFKEKWMYIVAVIVPICIAIIHSAIADTWVTGHGNIAVGDMQAQLIPIAYEIWDKVHSGNWFSMNTWHLLDGVNFNSVFGFFHSPFTLIMVLFPRTFIPDYMQLTMLIKWSLASLTMVYFFYHTRFNTLENNKRLVSLFLGLAFALGNGIMSFILYVQFMDVIICFPILLLLVEKIVSEKKWKLYYLLLTYIIWSNMYLAFQVCIFLVIWFFMNLCVTDSERLRKTIVFALSSFLSGLTWMSGVLSGIGFAQQRHESTSVTRINPYLEHILVEPWDFVKQFFFFRDIEGASSQIPNIYISVTVLSFVLLLPFIKIDLKSKIYMILISILMTASFFSGHLSLIWHVFNAPNGVHHRFMYIYSFWILFVFLQIIVNLDEVRLWKYIVSTVVLTLGIIYVLSHIAQSDSLVTYFATILMVVFFFVIMVFYRKGSIKYNNFICFIAICGIIELCANAYYTFSFYDSGLFYGKGGFVDQAVKTLSKAELDKGERMISQSPTPNIGMITGQNSEAGFASDVNVNNKTLHEALGMSSNSSVEFGVRGGSPLINLIYNIRYGHGESDKIFSDTELVVKDEYWSLYRMNRLAGLGYMVNEDIVNWNISDMNCFQFQNDYIKKSVGGDDIFYPVDVEIQCGNYLGFSFEPDKDMLDKGMYVYNCKAVAGTEYDSFKVDVTVLEDADLYMFFKGNPGYTISILEDGELVHQDVRRFDQSTYHIGDVKKGQNIVICAVPKEGTAVDDDMNIMFNFSRFDNSAYNEAYDKLSKNIYNIDIEESDYIKGTIHADNNGIMMTSIPASGFEVYVDSEKTDYKVIAGALMGVPLDKGDHVIEFRYNRSYRSEVMSLLIFMIYIAICIYDHIRNKKVAAVSEVQ